MARRHRGSGDERAYAKGSSARYGLVMTWIEAVLWGLFGGFAVEGLDLYGAVRRHGCWPWRVHGPREVGAVGYFVAELFRLAIGSGLAWALAESGQITTAVGAVAVGVAAPLIVERLTRAIPLTDSERNPMAVPADTWRPTTASRSDLNGQQVSAEKPHAHADKAEEFPPEGDQPERTGE